MPPKTSVDEPVVRLAAPPQWLADGACADSSDPEMFTPLDEDGRSGEPARRVCAGCPLRRQCLDYAISTRQPVGIWGGCSTNERAQVVLDRAEQRLTRGGAR